MTSLHDEFLEIVSRGLVDTSLDQCSRWARQKIVMPAPYRGKLDFSKFPWQKEILDSRAPMTVIRKGAQLGFSIAGVIRALYQVDSQREDVLYVLPTDKLASTFSQARLDAIVGLSTELADLFTKANSVTLKKTKHHSNLYIRGSMSESGLVSVPVGTVVIDEYDRCNTKVLGLVMERMSAYIEKCLFALSTPTLPEFGIDELHERGTQETFHFKCPSCSKLIELRYPESLVICGDSPNDPTIHSSYLQCTECKAKLPHETKAEWLSTGRWVPSIPGNREIRSFWVNQLYGPGLTPGEFAVAAMRAETDEILKIEFVNQKIGVGYLPKGGKISQQEIDRNRGTHRKDDPRPDRAGRMITMGVDVGSNLEVCIAEYLYNDGDPMMEPHLKSDAKILWEGRIPGHDFGALDNFMSEWQVLRCCIDSQPENVLAKAFARRFHGFVDLVQYRKGTSNEEIKEQEDDDGIYTLTVDRTSFLDYSIGRFHKNKVIIPVDTSYIWVDHVMAQSRTYVPDEFGRPKAVYLGTRADHGAHAFAYAEIAHVREYSRKTGRVIKPGN